MESVAGGGDGSPNPVRTSIRDFHFHLFYVSVLVADHGVELRGIENGKTDQVHVGMAVFFKRNAVSVFRKPDGIGQSEEDVIVMAREWFRAEKCIAESVWILLHNVEDF